VIPGALEIFAKALGPDVSEDIEKDPDWSWLEELREATGLGRLRRLDFQVIARQLCSLPCSSASPLFYFPASSLPIKADDDASFKPVYLRLLHA
jgi:hypothetical protein